MTAAEAALVYAERDPEKTRTRVLTWQDPDALAAAAGELTAVEMFDAIAAGELPPPPIAVLMRMEPVEWSSGHAVFEGEPGEEHYNPIGVVHGGYASTLLDTVLGCAVQTTLGRGGAYTTIGLELKFVRPITRETGRVRAEAGVVHRGGRQATAEARMTSLATGKLLAHGTTTCMVFEPATAERPRVVASGTAEGRSPG